MAHKLSREVDNLISFLSGIIFYNGIMTLSQGNLFVAILSFLTIIVVVLMKRFVDWTIE